MALTFAGIVAAILLLIWAASLALGRLSDGPPVVPAPAAGAESSVSSAAPAQTVPVEAESVVATPASTADAAVSSTAEGSSSSNSVAKPQIQTPPAEPKAPSGVVVIDAGHQGRADTSLEPIGPGATEKKPKVAGGATGAASPHVRESEVNLQVALRLQQALESRGVKVIMVRTSEDVNVANSERAAVANSANAALFVRLHCDGADNPSTHGLSTLIPASNQWTAPIVTQSALAGKAVHRAVIASTGATDRGVVNRGDLSGFNWSKVPTILVEMGFMSNAAENKRLTTSSYQQKLAEGLAAGVVAYLGSR